MAEFHVPSQYPTITEAYEAAKAAVLSTGTVQSVIIAAGDYFDFPLVVDVDGIDFVGPYTGTATVLATATFNHSSSPVGTYTNSLANLNMNGIRVSGNRFQKLVVNRVTCTNNDSDCVVMSNTGVDGATNTYSRINVSASTFVANVGKAIVVSAGYVDAVNCSFISPTDEVCASIDLAPDTDKVSGLKVYQGSFTGQLQAHYGPSNVPDDKYYILNIERVSIKTTGVNYSCVTVSDASVRLVDVVLNNPESPININKTGESLVTYKNLTVPAGIVSPSFSTALPRNRIQPDILGAGGVVVNDGYGNLASLRGTVDGQSLVWSASSNRWIANLNEDALRVYDFFVNDISTWVVGDVVSVTSSSAVKALNNSEDNAKVIGVVGAVAASGIGDGGTITAVMAGRVTVSTDLSGFSLGEPVYVGSTAGKVVRYSDIPIGGWISAVGTVIDPVNNIVAYQPRLIGTK